VVRQHHGRSAQSDQVQDAHLSDLTRDTEDYIVNSLRTRSAKRSLCGFYEGQDFGILLSGKCLLGSASAGRKLGLVVVTGMIEIH
jgi:hypothetical protein